MVESSPSRTALVTSLMRALHSRCDPSPLLDDPWGDRLVPPSERERMSQRILARMDSEARARALQAPDSFLDKFLLANASFPGVVIRSRYAEDALREATIRGVRQYVLIGAGFDSFALRRPAFSDVLEIFEVDHPATQTMKTHRISECGISLPQSVHFIAADLANEDLVTALARSSFRSEKAAFFSWLGVTVYLTREANLSTLRAVATCGVASVGPLRLRWPTPFAPRALHPLHHYYEVVRPSSAHQYFQPWCRLCLFPWHRRPGSQVPYESLDESHASCTPDTT
jgi:methyltransferase (TIGR00027 family)